MPTPARRLPELPKTATDIDPTGNGCDEVRRGSVRRRTHAAICFRDRPAARAVVNLIRRNARRRSLLTVLSKRNDFKIEHNHPGLPIFPIIRRIQGEPGKDGKIIPENCLPAPRRLHPFTGGGSAASPNGSRGGEAKRHREESPFSSDEIGKDTALAGGPIPPRPPENKRVGSVQS